MSEIALPLRLVPERLIGRMQRQAGDAPIPGATWYMAQEAGDGLAFRFPCGALAGAGYLAADMLLDGQHVASFTLILQEGEHGPRFGLNFGLLPQCSARMRAPLEAVNQNRWRYEREGAWLKPRCRYERVDLRRVDRMLIEVERKSDRPVRWCITPVTATVEEPPRLAEPVLPQGPLLDELGQSRLHEWPARSRTPEQVIARLHAQLAAAPAQRWPETFSRWGGWLDRQVKATGFFRTCHDGRRWWLVDPDGYLFWSTGLDCVRVDTAAACDGLESALAWMPDPGGPYAAIYSQGGGRAAINYLAANLIRAFGPQEWYDRWAAIALAGLRRVGMNTVANWSDWRIASNAGFPYVRPLEGRDLPVPMVYRDFPDVFHPTYPEATAAYAETLRETAGDPALIGYFLMNEPEWAFAQETPAAGMLFNTPSCASRLALAAFLRERYGDQGALSAAWGVRTTFDALAEGEWGAPLNRAAQADLADFSAVMVQRLFGQLSDACREVDPNHLNLGVRYYTVPPAWALEGMRAFDVFSMNCYRPRVPAQDMARVSALLGRPVLIGEWHFGALDVGLPASGIGHVPDQRARGQAFRVYLEDAAAQPWCVGAHYFTLYDQSAIGRFDGESYNIGFLDVCNRPYEPLADAARASHERLYAVAAGEVTPYGQEPEYLPLLFV